VAAYPLYVIRHAIAQDRGPSWPDDSLRPLTDEGASQFQKAMRGLSHMGVSLDVVLASPLVRAQQTADIVVSTFDPCPHLVTVESLAPGRGLHAVMSDLARHARRTSVAVVGHAPDLGSLAAYLIGLRGVLALKKGGVCRVDVESPPTAGHGTLRWLLTPTILRSLRR
jgi:phosphohistidine phosphatase